MAVNLGSAVPATPLDCFGTLRQGAAPAVDAKDQAKISKIKETAQDFEAFFVTHAFDDMFAAFAVDEGGRRGGDLGELASTLDAPDRLDVAG